MYNCVLATTKINEPFLDPKTNVAGIDSSYLNDFVEDEFGVIHIGPWQYSKNGIFSTVSDPENQKSNSEKEVLRDLKYSDWEIGSSLYEALDGIDGNAEHPTTAMLKSLPRWLYKEYMDMFRVHKQLRGLKATFDTVCSIGSSMEKRYAVSYAVAPLMVMTVLCLFVMFLEGSLQGENRLREVRRPHEAGVKPRPE